MQETRHKRRREERDATAGGILSSKNDYCGWAPSAGATIDRAEYSSLTPERFFTEYVAQRKPVVIVGHVADPQWKAASWTLQHLKKKAGDCKVKVEYRDHSADRFGQSKEEKMRFGDFLQGVIDGDDLHYMTTQDLVRDEEGRPEIIAPPLTEVVDEFPMRPQLTGNLVPANINMWIGNSKEGSMSGLHHDYHDNLYILLKGRKHFDLFSPADTQRMYTKGTLLYVHSNGLINYTESGLIRADGAEESAEAAEQADAEQKAAEEEVAQAEEAVRAGVPGAAERLAAAEERLEAALDAVLNAEMDNEADAFDDVEEDEDGEEEDEEDEGAPKRKRAKRHDAEDNGAPPEDKERKQKETPLNFSLVDMMKPREERSRLWPLVDGAVALECDVREGEMLFLPAGWFHNVTSFSSSGSAQQEQGAGDGRYHMAFNYWFHPPDALEDFRHPYRSDFWARDWDKRMKNNGE